MPKNSLYDFFGSAPSNALARAGGRPDVRLNRISPESAGYASMALPSPLGDIAGLAADAWGFAKSPNALTPLAAAASLAGAIPGIPSARAMKLFRAGDINKTGPTFFSTTEAGTAPYAAGGRKVGQYSVSPSSAFDTGNIEHRSLYEQFIKETGSPAGYGGKYPFWTAEPDLKKWLGQKGLKFDAIIFGENTGIPSVAVYNRSAIRDAAK